MFRMTLASLAAIFAVSTTGFAAETNEAATTPVGHGVSSIGLIFETDLGEETFAKLLEVTKGKVLNLKEVSVVDNKVKINSARLITMQPKTLAGQKTIEVKVRTFNGLPPEPKKVAELLELAKKTEPFVSEEEYKKKTTSEDSAGKVYETYSATDPNAPERCFSAPNGVLSMKDQFGREFAGTQWQCNDWLRRVGQVYNIYCRRSWEPRQNLSTYGCHCIY